MSRIPLIRSNCLPYHLFGRSNNREWFYLPQEEVWAIFRMDLERAARAQGLRVHSFVLMSNHYHLLATAAEDPVDRVMAILLKRIADAINRRAGRINHVFGGPYKWSLIEHWFGYHHVLRYIYQNPLRARLCRDVKRYSFSSLQLLGGQRKGITLSPHPFEKSAYEYITSKGYRDWKEWLNTPYDEEHVRALRRAVYRRRFEFRPDRISRKLPSEFIPPSAK